MLRLSHPGRLVLDSLGQCGKVHFYTSEDGRTCPKDTASLPIFGLLVVLKLARSGKVHFAGRWKGMKVE